MRVFNAVFVIYLSCIEQGAKASADKHQSKAKVKFYMLLV